LSMQRECYDIQREVGFSFAEDLLECSGEGSRILVRNKKNGTELVLPRRFELRYVADSANGDLVVDVANRYIFKVNGRLIIDFFQASPEEIVRILEGHQCQDGPSSPCDDQR
ncbi:MAG: hypothetical protein K8R59_03585, partial [Thermoanaerobaculales bacterium]|nr:hypothetical protein [Thermoanaerobaculales bacterium]